MFVPRVPSGQYTGTETAAYSAEFIAQDTSGTPLEADLRNVPIGLGEVQTFVINYSSTGGSAIRLSGGYNGGGQNPSSVNTFLSYSRPTNSHVMLATGTQAYTVVVFYSNAVIASSFSATLNGNSVSNLFHPQPGTSEAVNISLLSGRNLLDLKIDGNLPNRVATDTDRLVFDVQ